MDSNKHLSASLSIIIIITLFLKEVNKMLELIQKDPVTCVVALIIVIALIVYLITYRKGILKKAALYAVAKAEEAWGSNTGRIKFAEAYLYIKKNYPIITFFVSEQQITDYIEEALSSLKEIIATKESIAKKEVESAETEAAE
jgi:hypothetical protein